MELTTSVSTMTDWQRSDHEAKHDWLLEEYEELTERVAYLEMLLRYHGIKPAKQAPKGAVRV